ncbi:NAD(P)-dependent oxidoreductase [Actinomadura macrotermitis]|uniref:3-sulfolactaldehyde reductase n=1 Tax=Actinomadura macrotermitis TaxID=2585200 RepID=A0A7K0BXZ8_9ACTN|nr:NAD(P)-binding domain-containing protein [Actinomadura macrotermitis]MQY05732.1 3-sulfolactaldehyde reductase [Actinomadura macrotermitis]
MPAKSPVTVVGLGPMGATMAAAFLAAGHPITVWNRTAAKAAPLAAKGAALAATPADALAAAELVVISQTHYQAMYDSLGGSEAALKGRTLVNLSSGSPTELRAAADWAAGHGAVLLTGGIMVPPPGIGTPGAYVHYSGPRDALDRHRATLEVLGRADHQGDDPGLAMLFYQAELYLFWSTLAAYMHAVALVGSAGVPASRLLPYAAGNTAALAGDGPMGFLKILTAEIEAGAYPGGENSLLMQKTGAEHLVHAAADAGIDTRGPAALRDLFQRAVDAGHGADGLSSVIEAVRNP